MISIDYLQCPLGKLIVVIHDYTLKLIHEKDCFNTNRIT